MPYVGRRTLFLSGLTILTTIWLVLGATGVPHRTSGLSWTAASLLTVSGFVAYVCMIPVIFAVVSEIPSSTLRSKSVALARFTYAVLNVAANVLTTYQLNPTAWAWGAKSGFFWAGSSIVGLLFVWSYVPEPKGKTVAELNLLFEKRVPARKFACASVTGQEVVDRIA
jgi:MFS transporter, SP family, general alpha glucoside:H+ symporter